MTIPKGIIVLEGPDHSGKTTLADHLVKKYDAEYLHATFPFPQGHDVFSYHLMLMLKAINYSQTKLVIIDRLWPSELVYGCVHRGGCSMPRYEILIDRLIRKHAGVYVFCLHSRNQEQYEAEFEKDAIARKEVYATSAGSVFTGYHALYSKMAHRRDVMPYYYTEKAGKDIDGFLSGVLSMMRHMQILQYPKALTRSFKNYLGSAAMATRVLIGDESNYDMPWWPFFAYNNCSKFLLEQLEGWWDDSKLCFVNISNDGGEEAVRWLVETNHCVPIVMGRKAMATVARLKLKNSIGMAVPCRYLHHPQWYRRFHRNDYLLQQTIREM